MHSACELVKERTSERMNERTSDWDAYIEYTSTFHPLQTGALTTPSCHSQARRHPSAPFNMVFVFRCPRPIHGYHDLRARMSFMNNNRHVYSVRQASENINSIDHLVKCLSYHRWSEMIGRYHSIGVTSWLRLKSTVRCQNHRKPAIDSQTTDVSALASRRARALPSGRCSTHACVHLYYHMPCRLGKIKQTSEHWVCLQLWFVYRIYIFSRISRSSDLSWLFATRWDDYI